MPDCHNKVSSESIHDHKIVTEYYDAYGSDEKQDVKLFSFEKDMSR